VAPELIFDAQPGQLFVSRDAGNFISPTSTASFEYAVAELGVPLILVLGHSCCGAVDATIKVMESGKALPGHLPVLTDAIAPAVERVRGDAGSLLDNSIVSNVKLNVEQMTATEPILGPAVARGDVAVAGGVYDIATGQVSFIS
jgi:carbonic anhydrase